MQIESAVRIATQLINKINPACRSAIIVGEIAQNKPTIKNIDINIIPSDIKLLNALLLECSTPIRSSSQKLVRLYQNVQVTLHLP